MFVGDQVEINGVKGFVTVDNQDGTWTVNLQNNTIYFAVRSEIEEVQENQEIFLGWYEIMQAREIVKNAQVKNRAAYLKAARFAKDTMRMKDAFKKPKWSLLWDIDQMILKSNLRILLSNE